MRLWHEKLIHYLPRQQLLGQHRECCALRGKGWGKPHATVNYVFKHPYEWLVIYHYAVMKEMGRRGYTMNVLWFNPGYRGKALGMVGNNPSAFEAKAKEHGRGSLVYPEHDEQYLQECLDNLAGKGIHIEGVK